MADRTKVLLVDDSPKALADMSTYMTGAGYDVETANDGAAAIIKAKEFRPDVMVLDVQMPVFNGFEVLHELQRRAIRTRVIMLTGYSMEREDTVRAMRAGACDYFIKPTSPAFLEERIRRHLLDETSANLVVARSAANRVRLAQADTEQLREKVAALEGEKSRLIAALDAEKETTARRLADRSRAESRRDKWAEVAAKVVYVCVAVIAMCLLVGVFQLPLTPSLVAALLILIGLLLIPMERVTQYSSSLFGWKTQFRTKESTEPVTVTDEEVPTVK